MDPNTNSYVYSSPPLVGAGSGNLGTSTATLVPTAVVDGGGFWGGQKMIWIIVAVVVIGFLLYYLMKPGNSGNSLGSGNSSGTDPNNTSGSGNSSGGRGNVPENGDAVSSLSSRPPSGGGGGGGAVSGLFQQAGSALANFLAPSAALGAAAQQLPEKRLSELPSANAAVAPAKRSVPNN